MSQQRYVILAFVVGAFLVGTTVRSGVESAMLQFQMTNETWFGLVSSSTLVAFAVAAGLFVYLMRTPRTVQFTDEVIVEFRKVTWPSRDETLRATTTVVLTTLFVAGLLGLYDLLWKNVADLFLFTEV